MYSINPDAAYQQLIRKCLEDGDDIITRNSRVKRVIAEKIEFKSTPLISIRKTAWKSALREWEYFMGGHSHLDFMHSGIKSWWEPFCTITPNTMSYSYGQVLRRLYCPDKSKVIEIVPKKCSNPEGYTSPSIIEISTLENKGKLTGKKYKSNKGETFVVLDIVGKRRTNLIYRIQFLETGYITEYREDVLKKGRVKDVYSRSLYGVGCLGRPNKMHPAYIKAKEIWDHMMQRCFDINTSGYKTYGNKGYTVCTRWRVFEYFLNDISKLPGYEEWLLNPSDYQIDKDYYASKVYSPDVCVFLPASWNSSLSKSTGKYILYKGEIKELECLVKADIYKYLGVSRNRHIEKLGYRIEHVPNTNILYRHPILIDQVANVIDSLKNHQGSRRNIITTWIPQHVKSGLMNPTNCHNTQTQFFVKDGILDIFTLQRSVDVVVGLPHNLIQMWAFGLWMAQKTGLIFRKLTWLGTDCHVYEQHFDLAQRMLEQQPQESPMLMYTPSSEDFKADDFFLGNTYEPALTERAEMVV